MTLDVIHSFPIWLPQTQTWLYNQVKYLPPSIASHVICERTTNLDQFDLPRISKLNDLTSVQRLRHRFRYSMFGSDYVNFLHDRAENIHADVLHSHFGYIGWANMQVARQTGMRHFVTFYGLDVTFLPKAFFLWYSRYRKMFSQVDGVLCEGPFMARTIVEKLGCPPEKVRVHHLGVTLDHLPYQPRPWLGNGPLKVLIAASFREKKGIPYAIEALGRISTKVDLAITIIGDAGQKSEKKKIIDTLNKYQLMPRTRMLGYQSFQVMFEQAYQHHLFLSPSVTARDGDTEGGAPVSIIEMAATGMPVVSSRHCDIPEILEHQKTGLLSAERDIDGITDNLLWLIDNPEKWGPLTTQARAHIEAEFNADIQGHRLAEIYTGH